MKAAASASLQLFGGVLSIILTIGGAAWSGEAWLSGKFKAEDDRISEAAKEHGQSKAELKAEIAKNKAEDDAKIAALRAAIDVMAVTQPRPQRDLMRDLMPTKSARMPGKGLAVQK
jgi:uncharacterized protein YpuA (DUF1002 family)